MSENEVEGDEYVLKKANQANLKEEENKGMTGKVNVKKTDDDNCMVYKGSL